MIKTIALWLIVVVFGLAALGLTAIVLSSMCVSAAALAYRLMPGPSVPLRYNLRNVMLRWKNTLVTAAAFTVVVGLLVFMLAFVNGLFVLTESSGRPGNVMVLKSGSTDESFSDLPGTAVADVLRLSEDVRTGILKSSNDEYLASKEVYIIVNQPIPNAPPSGKQRRFVQMRGVHSALIAAAVHHIDLEEGRWFGESGVVQIDAQGKTPTKDAGSAADSTASTISPTSAASAVGLLGMPNGEGPLLAASAFLAERFGMRMELPPDRAIEVVIGAGIAKEFGRDRPGGPVKCGEILSIGGRNWIVVGIMGSGGSSFSSEVWCRDYLVQELFGRRNSYSSFVVATRDAKSAEKLSKELKEFKELPVNAQPETEYYSKLNQTNKTFFVAAIIVAVIMAIGGVLGVMNTMYAAISQRAKDIGVLRLLGFTRWQILVSFLLESLAIAFLGGILGCLLGYMCDGLTATSIVTGGQGGGKSVIFRLVVDARIIGAGLLLTFIMGAAGGLVPAVAAMRLRPLESLR